MKFVKKCGASFASEETFEVYSGSTKLYTGSGFANNEERTIEQCLTSSTNNQYTVKLIDSYGDSWSNGAYLAIYGVSGNLVFKNFLTDSLEETHQFSLYYGISESALWKITSGSVTGTWTEYNFGDSSWTEVTLGSVSSSVSGTQYFRKQFTGLASMAAYDVRLYYKAGVVAYINGAEVYRDNMPSGDVTSDTAATSEYDDTLCRVKLKQLLISMLIWLFWLLLHWIQLVSSTVNLLQLLHLLLRILLRMLLISQDLLIFQLLLPIFLIP